MRNSKSLELFENYKNKLSEDVIRTDIPADKFPGSANANVSLNTLRDTLELFDRFYELADEFQYTEGVSSEFCDELYNFFDSVVDKEYYRIKDEIEKTEKREMKKSKK